MRKFFRDLFCRLMALWALLSFALSFLIILFPSLLCGLFPPPKGQAGFIRIARGWMRIWLPLVGCPPRILGEQHFQRGKTYIVVCNHTSLMDPPMSSPFIPGPNKTIAGMHMCIYPEGTRNKSNQPLKEFHEGAFRLAKDTGKPIMPAVIFGTARMLPTKGGMTFRPGKLEMHFLDPIPVTEEITAKELKDKAFRIMWDHYEANRNKI